MMKVNRPPERQTQPELEQQLPRRHAVTTRILIVEDSEAFGQSLCSALRKRRYECVWVTDGFQAVQAMMSSPASVVLMDLMLPHMNGTAATRQIRWENPIVPIIGMSAVQDPTMVADFMAAGGTAFLDKRRVVPGLFELLDSLLGEDHQTPGD